MVKTGPARNIDEQAIPARRLFRVAPSPKAWRGGSAKGCTRPSGCVRARFPS